MTIRSQNQRAVLISIIRTHYQTTQTLGKMVLLNANREILFECETLELPWRHNQKQVSCIPAGRYQARRRTSAKYGNHLHILNVPNRELILIHQANYAHQLLGCIAVGKSRVDIDGDGNLDVTSSVATKTELLKYIGEEVDLVIS
jgi:hypothetical protein